jgi:hypothetical protein
MGRKIRTTVLLVKIGVVCWIWIAASLLSCTLPLSPDTSDTLPRCELLHKFRYDQEIISFWWGRKLKINSREVDISLR